MTDRPAGLFSALLKHWRHSRGLSQLDLGIAADVSARHISFLETGRSLPSPEMVLTLGNTLGVPLRHIDEMLVAAGHDVVYDHGGEDLPESVRNALAVMKEHHEPYPLVVVDQLYNIIETNTAGVMMLDFLLGEDREPLPNLARLTFDERGARELIVNFDEVGRELLWRIQREVLASPQDTELQALLDELTAMPSVNPQWRTVDLSTPAQPALVMHLQKDGVEARFITTVTVFQAPQNLSVDGLQIESWFPADEQTSQLCHMLSAEQ